MTTRTRRHPRLTYANVMATIAVVLGLTGTSLAASHITGSQIVNGSITGKDIKVASVPGNRLVPGAVGPAQVSGLSAADFAPSGLDIVAGAASEGSQTLMSGCADLDFSHEVVAPRRSTLFVSGIAGYEAVAQSGDHNPTSTVKVFDGATELGSTGYTESGDAGGTGSQVHQVVSLGVPTGGPAATPVVLAAGHPYTLTFDVSTNGGCGGQAYYNQPRLSWLLIPS